MKAKFDKHDKFEEKFHLLLKKVNFKTYELLPVSSVKDYRNCATCYF